eukprot:TRINITY_DN2443_c0_g1_i1.p1 TRINITY_DN2443_c0_g1~~TRINITY_DN2443_c0_g1_i1.p1  ORF type:complete len:71 (-),score=5.61 TRINITY_DN2443_c0_g1_i1:15-227(-)
MRNMTNTLGPNVSVDIRINMDIIKIDKLGSKFADFSQSLRSTLLELTNIRRTEKRNGKKYSIVSNLNYIP